ncbi:YdeI/OmpD-associated family protein [Ekhidna sp. To15]|uniref:YdeI/OmpD-associated family protein n=1 Tax=Ekhidna sp. To15 TaxID=3395267 RepID=UPI003F51E5D3
MATFFSTPDHFRKWLEENHKQESELWVGYYKKATGKPSITWPESVDQALCFGWIDGIRKKIDEEAYQVRFTPRKPTSHWSHVNIKRIAELKKEGLVMEAGLTAYSKKRHGNTGQAFFEQKNVKLSSNYEEKLKVNKEAWAFFNEKLAPSFRKQSIWWVMSAKREETRDKRFNTLIECSAKGEKVPPLKWTK